MKPLLVLARITFVGCLWSIIFIEGVRVIMLESWHFDIFWPPHWLHAWNLWSSGWVIDTPKEWAFILLIVAFLPMLLTGWIALSLIPWEHIAWKMVSYPFNLVRSLWRPIKIVTKQPVIVKRKSYKEIRPTGPRSPIYDYNDSHSPAVSPPPANPAHVDSSALSTSSGIKDKAAQARDTFSHALFNLSDEDDDFDLDFDSFEKSDIFKIDSSKKKREDEDEPKKPKAQSSKNGQFSFDDEDDEDYVQERENGRKNSRNNYKEERRRDDEDNYEYKSRRRVEEDDDYRRRSDDGRHEGRKNDNRRDRREERNSVNESKNNRRRENNGKDNKNDNRKPAKENVSSVPHNNPIADILTQKGYDVIANISIKNTLIDFAGVADGKICLCLVDREPGDWLADEERFNDEEPLWFSESSHRISPVRKVDLAARALSDRLESNNDVDFEIKPFVIIEMGNIINAEDMFEVWNDIGVEVTRINRGSPKEIKLFSKTLEEADEKVGKNKLDALKKLMRNVS